MKTYQLTFTAGETKTLPSGNYFHVLETVGPVDIQFIGKGQTPLNEFGDNVEAGYFARPEGGFSHVKITSATAQTIKCGVSRGTGGYNRTIGSVDITNSPIVQIAPAKIADSGGHFFKVGNFTPNALEYAEVGLYSVINRFPNEVNIYISSFIVGAIATDLTVGVFTTNAVVQTAKAVNLTTRNKDTLSGSNNNLAIPWVHSEPTKIAGMDVPIKANTDREFIHGAPVKVGPGASFFVQSQVQGAPLWVKMEWEEVAI